MPVQVKEFTQYHWLTPNVDLFRDRGDLYTLDDLWPDPTGRQLRRAPDWSTHVGISNLTNIRGMFYDRTNERYVFIGTNTSSQLSTVYYGSDWMSQTGPNAIVTGIDALGGLEGRNVAYWGGDLYVIGDDGTVYRGSDYTSSLSSIHVGNGVVLTPYGDRMYLATDDGTLHRLDDTDSHFETYLDPVGDIDIVYMTPFRGYLAVFALDGDGTMRIYRVPDQNPTTWHEIARLPGSGDLPDYGCLFAVHNDKIYFSPGRTSTFGSYYDLDIWTWNGSSLEKVTTIVNDPSARTALGLLSWNGHLLYYSNLIGTHSYQLLVGDQFVDFISMSEGSGDTPFVTVLGPDLVSTAYDDSAGRGVKYLDTDTFIDGSLTTSWLDMGNPGREKRLNRITVLLDGNTAGFKVVIKYRTNDTTAWTTATTANNTKRATIDLTTNVSFYTLQLKIELDDDTAGGNEDIRINALSVVYTEAER